MLQQSVLPPVGEAFGLRLRSPAVVQLLTANNATLVQVLHSFMYMIVGKFVKDSCQGVVPLGMTGMTDAPAMATYMEPPAIWLGECRFTYIN
jgi:hypothetical protein